MKQEQVQKARSRTAQREAQAETLDLQSSDALKNSLDDILDEIDEVLEENAQAFVDAYIQKGGE